MRLKRVARIAIEIPFLPLAPLLGWSSGFWQRRRFFLALLYRSWATTRTGLRQVLDAIWVRLPKSHALFVGSIVLVCGGIACAVGYGLWTVFGALASAPLPSMTWGFPQEPLPASLGFIGEPFHRPGLLSGSLVRVMAFGTGFGSVCFGVMINSPSTIALGLFGVALALMTSLGSLL